MFNLSIEITLQLKEKLECLAEKDQHSSIEDLVRFILIKEINSLNILELMPELVNNLSVLPKGSIFNITDVIVNKSNKEISLQLIQELESLFEIYLRDTNQFEKYQLLYLDDRTLINTYLKL